MDSSSTQTTEHILLEGGAAQFRTSKVTNGWSLITLLVQDITISCEGMMMEGHRKHITK